MPTFIDAHRQAPDLADLLRRVEAGEEVVIGRGEEPVAKLTRVELDHDAPRPLDTWRGRVRIADDFDAPLSEGDFPLGSADGDPPGDDG